MKREAEFLVQGNHFKGFTNKECEFFPCHKGIPEDEFNCLFCYCPLVFMSCPGPYQIFIDRYGIERKDCSNCNLNHKGINKSWNFIQHWLNLNMKMLGSPPVEMKKKIRRLSTTLQTSQSKLIL